MIACKIELKQLDEAMALVQQVLGVFEAEQVDFKTRARILQRKGTIHAKQQQWKDAVEAFENSLFEHKTDAVKDLLIDARNKFKAWEIEQNTDPAKSDELNKEANALYKEKK